MKFPHYQLSPRQVAIVDELLKQSKVKMLVGLDKKCNCKNKIIAKKCCMKIEHETATKREKC